jgi:hypothetical protein
VGLALLAGVAGLVSGILYHAPYAPGAYFLFIQAGYLVPLAAAVAALVLQKHRLVIIGFLQGMLWVPVTNLVWDIVAASVDHQFGFTVRQLAGFYALTASAVLGVIAAILLLFSWIPAVDSRRVPMARVLPVIILCGVGLSQIASLIVLVNRSPNAANYAWGVAEILIGLAVTWYAVSLRAHALGGALVLGWATITATRSLAYIVRWWFITSGVGRVFSILEFILLATVVILAIGYSRGPSGTESEPTHAVTRVVPDDS